MTFPLKQLLKAIAIRILPRPVFVMLKSKSIRSREIDLSLANSIREKGLDCLSDPKKLEFDLLPSLGLNNENLREFPEELYPYCGRGLLHWQYPNQFSKYLVLLSKLRIERYLEIGVLYCVSK